MNRLMLYLILLLNLLVAPVFATENINHAVLITSSENIVSKFSNKELRLLYLGHSVTKNEQTFEPLINVSNPEIYNGFLQKVMFMTEHRYERQLISRVFRHGGEQPKRFETQTNLIRSLNNKKNAITFVSPEEASQFTNVHVIQRLW